MVSCTSKKPEAVTEEPSKADSILEISRDHFDSAVVVSKKSDSAASKTIYKIIKEIGFLTNVVEKYKQVEQLKKQTLSSERIVYITDTVYIETKKNFWGKEKVKTSVKSDSSVEFSIDSNITESIEIDTLQKN
jgi:hypothetical protein